MGLIFFFLTVLCIPFLPAGAELPRWAFAGLVAAGLLFRVWPNWWQWLLIGYMGLMAWRTSIGYDAAGLYCHFLFVFLIFLYAQRLDSLRTVAHGMAIAMTINSVVAVAQSYAWFMYDVSGHGALFFNRNMAGEAAAMTLVLVLGYRLWWYIPGLLPSLFWGGRASLIAVCVAGMLYVWRYSRIAALAVLPVGIGLAVLVWLQHGDQQDVFQTLDNRLGVLIDTVPHLNLFGHGLGSFIGQFPLYQRHSSSMYIRYEHAHDDLLEVTYDLGIIGLVAACLLICRLLRAPRSPAWYCLVVFLAEGCFGFPLYKPVTGCLAALCAGYLFVRSPALRDLFAAIGCRVRAWAGNRRDAPFRAGVPAIPAPTYAPGRSPVFGHYDPESGFYSVGVGDVKT